MPVDQCGAARRDIAQEHADLDVLHPGRSFAVLPVHPDRAAALLRERRLVRHQDAARPVAEVFHDPLPYVVAYPVDVPAGRVEQPLHAVGVVVAGEVRQRPAVLAAQSGQYAAHEDAGPLARFRASEPRSDPVQQRVEIVGPLIGSPL